MENQINTNEQNSQESGQNPVSQSVSLPEKPKVNYWMNFDYYIDGMKRIIIFFLILVTCLILISGFVIAYDKYQYNQAVKKTTILAEQLGYDTYNHLALGRVYNTLYYDNIVLLFTSNLSPEDFKLKMDGIRLEVISEYPRRPDYPYIPPQFTDDKVRSKLSFTKDGFPDPYISGWWLREDKKAIKIEYVDSNQKSNVFEYDNKLNKGNLVIIEYSNR